MTAVASEVRKPSGSQAALEWSEIEVMAPQLARTMRRYLAQLATFLAPLSVVAADSVLRQFARWLLANTGVENVADIRRDDLEDFKVWLAARRGDAPAADADRAPVLRADHRVGLARRPAAQPGHQWRHPAAP